MATKARPINGRDEVAHLQTQGIITPARTTRINMATQAGPVNSRDEVTELQTEGVMTRARKSLEELQPTSYTWLSMIDFLLFAFRKARQVGLDRQGNKDQRQGLLPSTANHASKDPRTNIMTTILSLPPELMATIFSHLSYSDKVNAACVCSYWRNIIDIPCNWKDFCPILNIDKLQPQHIKKMCIRMIRKVKIVDCLSMGKMKAFLEALPCLTNLSLHLSNPLDILYPGKKGLPDIECLTLDTPLLSTAVLRSFLQHMVHLKHLTLICSPEQNIFCALKDSMRLVSLDIKSPTTGITLAENSESDSTPIASMKELVLRNVYMGDPGLEFISRVFHQLQFLHLTLSPDVTSNGLEKLAGLRELMYLNFESAHFEHEWIEHLQSKLSKLKTLSLWKCTSISNECLQSISKMTTLLSLTVPIQDQELEGLHVLSQRCPSLKYLCLTHGNPDINQGLCVVQHMSCLQELVLLECSVHDDFWRNKFNYLKKLRILVVVNCQFLSRHLKCYLAEMSRLKKILPVDCKSIQNKTMRPLEEKAGNHHLKFLSLMGQGINDESIIEVCKSTPFLITLTIVSCNNVTENGLVAAVSNLPCLKTLLANISAETKHRLKTIGPSLQFYPE